ncbi:MAG: helix-turn-helix domain-containing protein [Alphaproteobacteria bacterium]|nr:helix-turn-helix domain-containing protein [Alphaproteobacteria bacterium]
MVAPEDLRALGRCIRRERKGRRLSQETLAEVANLHRNYIGRIERGECNASVAVVISVARALAVKPAKLFAEIM